MVGDGVQVPLVTGLAVERASAFEHDVVQVFSIDERGFAGVVVLAGIEGGVDGRAGLDIEPHAGAKVQLAGGVLAGRNVDAAAAGLAAGIHGFLEGRPGIVALAAGRAVIPDIEDALRGSNLGEGRDGQRAGKQRP